MFRFVLFLALASVSAFGQTPTAAEIFADMPGIVAHPDQLADRLNNKGDDRKTANGPGDEFLAFLHTGQTFFNRGDLMTAKLVIVNPTSGFASTGVGIYGRLFIPGPSGRYDQQGQVKFFYPEEGQNGYFPVSDAPQVIRAHQMLVGSGDPIGEYMLDFVIAERSGRLIQQVFARFFVLETGSFGKGLFTLTRALQSVGSQGLVEGRLPVNRKLNAFAGNPGYNWSSGGAVTDANGKYVTIYGLPPAFVPGSATVPQPAQQVASWDVMVHIPELRETLLLPRAFEVVMLRYPQPTNTTVPSTKP